MRTVLLHFATGTVTMLAMFDGFDPRVIRTAGKAADPSVVMRGDVSEAANAVLLRLNDWAAEHLETITQLLCARLGARGAWTHTVDPRTRDALLALADVERQRANEDRAACDSWRGQIDDAILGEWRDEGLAVVHDDEATKLLAAARTSAEAPVGVMVLLDRMIQLILALPSGERFRRCRAQVRLHRLPHIALSPRLLARPRPPCVLTAAA